MPLKKPIHSPFWQRFFLHDVIDGKLTNHPAAKLKQCQTLLADAGVLPVIIDEITTNITHLGFAKNIEHRYSLPLSGQIAQDADWLDAIGAMGVARAFYYGGKFGEVMYDKKIAPRTNLTHAQYRNLDNETILNHFDEKLFKLASMLNTTAARQIAKKRVNFMKEFVTQFKAEYDGIDY